MISWKIFMLLLRHMMNSSRIIFKKNERELSSTVRQVIDEIFKLSNGSNLSIGSMNWDRVDIGNILLSPLPREEKEPKFSINAY